MSSMHKVAGPSLAVIIALASLQSFAEAKELSVVGTGDGIELLRALSAAYSADNPDTTIMVPPSIGSGGGLAAVGADKDVLARVARPLSDSARTLGLVATPVFHVPSALIVPRGED